MASYHFKGLEEYERKIDQMYKDTEVICGKVTYEMAKIVADQIKSNIEALPAVSDEEGLEAYNKKQMRELTESEKHGLIDGFGISPIENTNGYWNVKLGFDGYNQLKTKKYKKGQPNVMIARSVESGSSVRKKTPFVRPAVSATRNKAIEKAKEVIDKDMEERFG